MYEYSARVIRVLDGDTVDVEIDLGLDIATHARIRLAGLNAAEMSTPSGEPARKHLEELLAAAGSPVTIRTQKDRREKYGRYLGTFLRTGGGLDVNASMVADGFAKVWDGRGARP
jgi:micrococcal nuclease